MKIVSVFVTRNKSISVKTLHTILLMNVICLKNSHKNQIAFVNDSETDRREVVLKFLKEDNDRIVWFDYSVSLDETALKRLLEPFKDGCAGVVLPAVNHTINWDMFKKKVLDGSTEPIHQAGLEFDTVVDKKVGENLYTITSTNPKTWALQVPKVYKAIKQKNTPLKLPLLVKDMFELFAKSNLKIYACTDAQVFITATHECFGNILNAAGVKQTA